MGWPPGPVDVLGGVAEVRRGGADRAQRRRDPQIDDRFVPLDAGLTIALIATAGLQALGALRGPGVVGSSATTEAVLGAVTGARAITRARPGLVMRALGISVQGSTETSEGAPS